MIHVLTAYQLELYEAKRFLRFIYSHPKYWIRGGDRQKLVWTMKVRLLFVLSISVIFSIFVALYYFSSPLIFVFGILGTIVAFPLILVSIHSLLLPVDYFLKQRILKQAKKILSLRRKNLTIIGITGSYGKTSQKEILEAILKKKYSVLTTEGNKNTPLGVGETIMKGLTPEHEIYIVEMGAYTRGNIRELCDLVSPDIAILTGITYQHLERFGSIEEIIQTKFELPEAISNSGLTLLDTTNEFVIRGFQQRKNKLHGKVVIPIFPQEIHYKNDFAGIEFTYEGIDFSTSLLAHHSAHPIIIAYEVAKHLGLDQDTILRGVKEIQPIKHRLEPIYNPQTNVWIIDDSYNGNIEGVRSTIELLSHTTDHRRLYLTPGLVELGEKSDTVHFEIGTLLAPVTERVLLIDSPATRAIQKGLLSTGYDENSIIIYPDTKTAHQSLSSLLESGDVIVFQNDWSDNYF